MLQALLASAGMAPDDVVIRNYPEFGQGVALRLGEVEAATGFRNNEPVQLAREGFATNLLTIDEITPLPGPGLTVGESTLASKTESLRAFVAATLRAMDEVAANPELGLDAAIAVVPELAEQREAQRAILDATIAMWVSSYTAEHGKGAIDRAAWATSLDFMRGLTGANIPGDLTADELVTEDLLP
jgi:NitT/TauT family transport system substrate-binding protein